MVKNTEFQKNCFISIGVILLYFFWPTVMKAFWETFGGGSSFSIGMMIYNVIGYLILIVLLFGIYHKSLKEEWKIFWENKKKNFNGILKYTLLLFFGILICNMIVRYIFHVGVTNNEIQLYDRFQESPFGILITVTLYYPLVEVIVFQKTIKQVIEKPWIFILVSSLFFGYFNIAFSGISLEMVIATLPYIFLNAVLAFSYDKSKNIVVPISTKMLYNLLVTVISFL